MGGQADGAGHAGQRRAVPCKLGLACLTACSMCWGLVASVLPVCGLPGCALHRRLLEHGLALAVHSWLHAILFTLPPTAIPPCFVSLAQQLEAESKSLPDKLEAVTAELQELTRKVGACCCQRAGCLLLPAWLPRMQRAVAGRHGGWLMATTQVDVHAGAVAACARVPPAAILLPPTAKRPPSLFC